MLVGITLEPKLINSIKPIECAAEMSEYLSIVAEERCKRSFSKIFRLWFRQNEFLSSDAHSDDSAGYWKSMSWWFKRIETSHEDSSADIWDMN